MPAAFAKNSTNVRNTTRKVEQNTMRAILVAVIGFAVVLVAVPAWARVEVALFALVFGALVCLLDENVRDAMRRVVGSRLRGNGTASGNEATKAEAKSPAARRAAT